MPEILVVSDAPWVHDEVRACTVGPDLVVRGLSRGQDVLPALRERPADLVVLDFQVGNMGGMATCLDLRLEEGAGRLAHVPVLMLLDRTADVFLARRSDAEGWVVKPIEPIRFRKAVQTLLAGGGYPGVPAQPSSETDTTVEPAYVPSPDSTAAVPGPPTGDPPEVR